MSGGNDMMVKRMEMMQSNMDMPQGVPEKPAK